MMGETRDRLAERAGTAAQDVVSKVQGVARETVSLALTEMRHRNLVRTGRNRLIFNRDALRAFANGNGQAVSVTTSITVLGKDRLLWVAFDRTLGGAAVPGIDRFTLVRRPPSPGK